MESPKFGVLLAACKFMFSAPRYDDAENWPCVKWDVEVSHGKTVLYQGPYSSGLACLDGVIARCKSLPWHPNFPTAVTCVLDGRIALTRLLKDDKRAVVGWLLNTTTGRLLTPAPKDVLASIIMDGAAYYDGYTFKEWADNLGYSYDSIKAKAIYDKCFEIGAAIARVVGKDDLDALREEVNEF